MFEAFHLLTLLSWLIEPNNRTFIGFLLTSFIIAIVWASLAPSQRLHYIQQLFQKSYWLNNSSFQDVFLILFNSALFAALGLSWIIFSLTIANQCYELLSLTFEPRRFEGTSATILFITFTVTLIILDDLSRYALHRLLHWRFFWRIHQLHHSATTLTPLSFLRVHPIEKFLYQLRSASIYGLCSGTFFFLVGAHPQAWLIFGIAGTNLLFNLLGANLRHSMIPISYGPLEKVFISPLQHQLHHSLEYSRKNYGSLLSIWDIIFSSWSAGNKTAPLPTKNKALADQLLLKSLD